MRELCKCCFTEFYHPIFEVIYNPAFAARPWDDVTRSGAAAAESAERSLMAPLYRHLRGTSDGSKMLISAVGVMYHLLVRDNAMRWPDLGTSPHWELAREIRVAGRFDGKIGGAATAATEHGLALTNTIADWTDSVAGYGVRVEPEQLAFVGTYFHAILRFSEACGDALAALYMLLSLTQSRTLLASVGFFDPEDFESTVNQIGGMRTTDQVRLA